MDKLIDIYNSYCQKIYVIDQLYNTNNSQMTLILSILISKNGLMSLDLF